MEMQQVRYFVALADTLNFTRAAEKCNVSQPALTRAIQQLEGEVGGLLLRRERTTTHLTDLGRLMRPYLEQILRQAEEAKQQAKGFLKLDRAELRLGVLNSIGPLNFTSFLGGFHHRHPGIRLVITEGTPQRLIELLQQGHLPPQELVDVPTVCGSLREALVALHNDRAFLTKGDVFSDDQIDAYMELKWEEVMRWETTPSPVEFDMYYSA